MTQVNTMTRRRAIKTALVSAPAIPLMALTHRASAASPRPAELRDARSIESPSPSPSADGATDVAVVIRNWFVNRCPLLTRLPWSSTPAPDFADRQLTETFIQVVGDSQITVPGIPGGIQTPFDFQMTVQLQNFVDAIERAFYHSRMTPSPSYDPRSQTFADRKMAGLGELISTNIARHGRGEVYIQYQAEEDLIWHTLGAIKRSGGKADVLFAASDVVRYFCQKGWRLTSLGETVFGTPVIAYKSSKMTDVTIVEAPLLQSGTSLAADIAELEVQVVVSPCWVRNSKPTLEDGGHWWAELAIDIKNETRAAWAEFGDYRNAA